MYVPRFIEPLVVEQMRSTPIVIIEGARAVGKTRLLGTLRESGLLRATFTMTDPTQLAAASENPLAWLRSLPTSFAIDEAQLLPELPLALKALLDETDESVHGVLTGSAAIGRTGLGGTDPLARRASRLTLEPLSEAELEATDTKPWSVIDQFFDGSPTIGTSVPHTADWENRAIRGGLPRYRVMNAERPIGTLHRQIDQDVKGLLTDDVMPGERMDTRTARDVLTQLLMHPGGELNATAISVAIGIDARTVNRYIDILERRFLVDEIPNFHRPSKKSARSTAKCYPADTALSGAALLATDRTMKDAATRGGMMEAHVVQQIRAHLGWAETSVTLTHWRENRNGRTSEVDLVLQDSQGRLVAIEIKASGAVNSSHFKGIRAFKNYYGERFHRGFVITTGEQAVAFDEDLWAVPLTCLSHRELWALHAAPEQTTVTIPSSSPHPQETDPMPSLEEAKIFVSYTHQDQNSSTGGNIRQFAADVVDALEGIHGRTVQLFLDVNDVRWGEDLWSRLDEELQASTFLMPFITPRYLKSEGCRREFAAFSEAAQRSGSEQLLLPLMWITPPSLRAETSSDPIVQRLRSTLHLDVTAARKADRGSADYANLVEEVAERLEQVITDRESAAVGATNTPEDDQHPQNEPEPGIDEYFAQAEELLPQAQADVQTFIDDFNRLGQEFEKTAVKLQAQTPAQMRASMIRISNDLRQHNEKLTTSASTAAHTWDRLMTNLNRGVNLYTDLNLEGVPSDLVESLTSMADELEGLDTAELEGIAYQMPKMSSKLVPTSKAFLSAVETIKSMEASIRSWLTTMHQPHLAE